MQHENQFIEQTIQELSKDFHFKREVWGKHFSGKNLRIDALMKPKDTSLWKNKNIIFGVEFKAPNMQESIRNDAGLAVQAIDYRHTTFGKYGHLPIFVCPGFITAHQGEAAPGYYGYISRLLCQMNIGELTYHQHYGWTIVYGESSRIWSEKNGVALGKTWSFETKFGNS